MHEYVRNIRPGWIAFGWFIAVALTSLILLALAGLGFVGDNPNQEAVFVAAALVAGFLVTGFFVGTRVAAAPHLNGLGMGIFSIVAWVAINLFLGEPTGSATWRDLDVWTVAGLLVLQAVAAIIGARLGVRWIRSGPQAASSSEA
ncbi:MAG: hypothetical protein WD737_12715 [Gemmatimonadota bacterium]